MSLVSAFEHLLGRKTTTSSKPVATTPASDNGRQLLGIMPPSSGDGFAPKVYAPATPSMSHVITNQLPALQMYGDPQGNRWLENDAGIKVALPVAPQPFDSRLNSSFHDPLRPGQTSRTPVNDGVFHSNPLLSSARLRVM